MMDNQPKKNINIQHKIVSFKYHLISTLFFVGLSSLLTMIAYAVCVVVFMNMLQIGISYPIIISICVFALALGAYLIAHVATRRLPETYRDRYLPAWLPLLTSLVSWSVCFLIAGGSQVAMMNGLMMPYVILNCTYVITYMFAVLAGNIWIVFVPPIIFDISFLISFTIFERHPKSRPMKVDKKFLLIMILIAAVCTAMIGGTILYRSITANILPQSYGYAYGGGYSSVDLWEYDIRNSANKLPELNEASAFTITDTDKFPVLDGAEAAYPVYSAFANVCYEFGKSDDSGEVPAVEFTNTIYAFERLINGDVDIFFGARPSQAQLKLAENAGVELIMTPIAYEAFVFIVDVQNPIDSLTTNQIKQIYSGKVTNWNEFGGIDNKIVAFQRPEDSGSQTMLQYIMGDTKIINPVITEVIGGMGPIIESIAEYRDAPESIGYTFKFFLTGMTSQSDNVKMLAIDGVEPTKENIMSRTYPYTTNLYAITIKGNDLPTVDPFVEWMLSEQGQYIIDWIGFVPLK